jgi:general secretion pathway protein I
MSPQRGFTLIEVLAAVAVLAIAMAAILTGMARYADSAHHIRQRTLALWVAQNRLSDLTAAPSWPGEGRSDGRVEMAGQTWRWDVQVQGTPDERLRRIDVSVRLDDGDGSLARLSTFMRNTGDGG